MEDAARGPVRRARSALLAALLLVALTAPVAASAAAPSRSDMALIPTPRGGRSVVLAFLPVTEPRAGANPSGQEAKAPPSLLPTLARRRRLAIGLLGATQGGYNELQALLDISQGTRVSAAEYATKSPPNLTFRRTRAGGGRFAGWATELQRAAAAPAGTDPGLLGSSIPGGAAYVGVIGQPQNNAVIAANRRGRIDTVSIGSPSNIVLRTLAQLDHRLVVVSLPPGRAGLAALDGLLALRAKGELVLVAQSPPVLRSPQMLPIGAAGLGAPHELTSASTHLGGIVAGIDVGPTILRWLRRPIPDDMKGEPITISSGRDAQGLIDLDNRLKVVQGRRFPALESMLGAWLLVCLAFAVAGTARGRRYAMRLGALAMFWLLGVVLMTGALQPSRGAELAYITLGSFVLAAITDGLAPWPRAALVPAAVTVLAYIVDLVFHSHLIVRSLLGPNPRFGSRYYGIGNELEAALPVLWFIAVAALLGQRERSRAAAATFAGAGLILGVAFGSARLGADVGGVITVGAGTAVATIAMLPGRRTWRSAVAIVLTPVIALVALAGLDLVTGANGHYTRTVLHAHGSGALDDIIRRRYQLAFNVFKRGLMPFATVIAALTVVYTIRFRGRLLAPVSDRPAWTAALWGGLASSIAGSLGNDSGPELLVIGTFTMLIAVIYIRGDPRLASTPEPQSAVGESGAVGAII